MEFCEKTYWCGRPDRHLGTCTESPGALTQLFDASRGLVAEHHERAAVMGRTDGGVLYAPVMPEFRPERFR